jgi:hypothetical protein
LNSKSSAFVFSLSLLLTLQSLFHGDDLKENRIQEVTVTFEYILSFELVCNFKISDQLANALLAFVSGVKDEIFIMRKRTSTTKVVKIMILLRIGEVKNKYKST